MELSGPTFKKIRQRKGFSVAETAEGICSGQFLRKYEAGNSDISLTNSLLLLDRINVTMDEFLYEYNELTFDRFFLSFEKKIETAGHTRSSLKQMKLIQELEALYEKHGELKYSLLITLVHNIFNLQYQEIFDLDWQPIRDYLQQVEQWDRFEYYLCSHSRFPLSNDELFQICLKLFRQPKRAAGTSLYTDDFLVRLALKWLRDGELILCQKLVDEYYNGYYDSDFMSYLIMDVVMKFVEGLLEVKNGNREVGIKTCETIVQFFTSLNIHPGYASAIYEHYIRTLNDSESRDKDGK